MRRTFQVTTTLRLEYHAGGGTRLAQEGGHCQGRTLEVHLRQNPLIQWKQRRAFEQMVSLSEKIQSGPQILAFGSFCFIEPFTLSKWGSHVFGLVSIYTLLDSLCCFVSYFL